jgi:hypothetical protein
MIQGFSASSLRPSLLAALVAFLSLAAPAGALASAENQSDQALAAAKAWIGQIDSGKYDDSYNFACDETRARYPEEQWVDVLKALRAPWGAVVNRQQLSHVYKANGVPGLDGECMVITYATNFKNYANVTENVVLKWEDGQWRGAGYFAGVATDPNAPPPTPNYSTDIQTEKHVQVQGQGE